LEVTLGDGSRLEIRPIEPDDRTALAEGFRRLSPESRYRRFFAPMDELSERDLDYLTRVDHHDHEALVAIEAGSGEGVGVARYVRTGAAVAEPAIVVADAWQGRGAGGQLLGVLADRAREEGITRFEAPVLATNDQAIRVLDGLGETTRRQEGREVVVGIDLPAEAPGAGRWPAVLKQIAAGTVQPARTLIELLWPERLGTPDQERRNLIVVGTDGSENAAEAVATAAELAAASEAAVHVVGAHRFLPTDRDEVAAAVGGAANALRERGLHVHEHLRRGDPGLVLTDVAYEDKARLVVVGAGKAGKTRRRIVGSVADFVSARSPCDVLIVRRRPAPETKTETDGPA
jgi:nucleotide-binding universal stress UspA family protein/RimJ/RimL family protein N-acetyltransferase